VLYPFLRRGRIYKRSGKKRLISMIRLAKKVRLSISNTGAVERYVRKFFIKES
jgi:hypothetical protein